MTGERPQVHVVRMWFPELTVEGTPPGSGSIGRRLR